MIKYILATILFISIKIDQTHSQYGGPFPPPPPPPPQQYPECQKIENQILQAQIDSENNQKKEDEKLAQLMAMYESLIAKYRNGEIPPAEIPPIGMNPGGPVPDQPLPEGPMSEPRADTQAGAAQPAPMAQPNPQPQPQPQLPSVPGSMPQMQQFPQPNLQTNPFQF